MSAAISKTFIGDFAAMVEAEQTAIKDGTATICAICQTPVLWDDALYIEGDTEKPVHQHCKEFS